MIVLLQMITYLQARMVHLLAFQCVLEGDKFAERG